MKIDGETRRNERKGKGEGNRVKEERIPEGGGLRVYK